MKNFICYFIICIVLFLTGCSNSDNTHIGMNNEVMVMSAREYLFTNENVCKIGDEFEISGWDEVAFSVVCTDFTCMHLGEACSASIINHTENENGYLQVFFYYMDKMIIVDSYGVYTMVSTEDSTTLRIDKKTDIYEADLNGENRKLVKSFDGGGNYSSNIIVVDGVLYLGGTAHIETITKMDETTENASNNIYAIDLTNYSVSKFEVDNSKEYANFILSYYEGKIYMVMRSYEKLHEDEIIDAIDEKWYQISLEEKTCELINEVDDQHVTFFGVINNKMYYSYWNNKILCREIGTDQEEVFLELDVDLSVATIYDGMIMVNTGLTTDGKNYDVEYTWFDEDKNIIKSHKYDEWLVVSNVLENRIIYMKPYEEGIPYYWIDKDNVENLHKEGTYIGPM